MKNTTLSVLLIAMSGMNAFADSDLSTQIDDLKVPANTAPTGVTSEKLYSVQNRYSRLEHKFEFTLGGAKTLPAMASFK